MPTADDLRASPVMSDVGPVQAIQPVPARGEETAALLCHNACGNAPPCTSFLQNGLGNTLGLAMVTTVLQRRLAYHPGALDQQQLFSALSWGEI